MRTRAPLLAATPLAGGVLASPALAAKPQPAQPLPTMEVEACGTTLLVEEASSNSGPKEPRR